MNKAFWNRLKKVEEKFPPEPEKRDSHDSDINLKEYLDRVQAGGNNQGTNDDEK